MFCPFSPWLKLKTFPCSAVPTELNNLREKADSIVIKSLLNLVRLKKTTGMGKVSFKRKITGLRCLEIPLTFFSQIYFNIPRKMYIISRTKKWIMKWFIISFYALYQNFINFFINSKLFKNNFFIHSYFYILVCLMSCRP